VDVHAESRRDLGVLEQHQVALAVKVELVSSSSLEVGIAAKQIRDERRRCELG
jgi:hypothetical protein